MVQIDISKPEIKVSDFVTVDARALRTRIRELVSAFLLKPRPITPTDADLLNDYLDEHRSDFRKAVEALAKAQTSLATANAKARAKFEHAVNDATARRAEIIAAVAVSNDFLTYRSEAKARHNDAVSAYEEEEGVISDLKVFLGAPYLPDIEAEKLTAKAILEILQNTTPKSPRKGQVVLMADDPIFKRQEFAARSALSAGLHSDLWGKNKTVPVRFSGDGNEVAEACSVGAVERGRHTVFHLAEGRPVSSVPWNEIDRFLPFAYRSLSVPLLPQALPHVSGFEFAKVLGDAPWREIEAEAKASTGNHCMVCGSSEKLTVHPRWRFREPIEGSYAPGVCVLEEFMVYCHRCASALRPRMNSLFSKSREGYVLTRNRAREEWLSVINRWQDLECEEYARTAYLLSLSIYRRRAKHNWLIDLTKQRSMFFSLAQGYRFDANHWIHGPEGEFFKIVGLPVYDQAKVRHYSPVPDVFEVPHGSTMESAAKLLENEHDFTLVDKGAAAHGKRVMADLEGNMSAELEQSLDETVAEPETLDVDVSSRPDERQSADGEPLTPSVDDGDEEDWDKADEEEERAAEEEDDAPSWMMDIRREAAEDPDDDDDDDDEEDEDEDDAADEDTDETGFDQAKA